MRGEPEILESGRSAGRSRLTTALLGLLLCALAISVMVRLDDGTAPAPRPAAASTVSPPRYRPDHGWTGRPAAARWQTGCRRVAGLPRSADAAAAWLDWPGARLRRPRSTGCLAVGAFGYPRPHARGSHAAPSCPGRQ